MTPTPLTKPFTYAAESRRARSCSSRRVAHTVGRILSHKRVASPAVCRQLPWWLRFIAKALIGSRLGIMAFTTSSIDIAPVFCDSRRRQSVRRCERMTMSTMGCKLEVRRRPVHMLSSRDRLQMVYVHTSRVTASVMQLNVRWKRTYEGFVKKTVRELLLHVSSDVAIAFLSVFVSLPDQAIAFWLGMRRIKVMQGRLHRLGFYPSFWCHT